MSGLLAFARTAVGSRLRTRPNVRQTLSVVAVVGLALGASACERLNTHEGGPYDSPYDATFATTGDSYTIGTRPNHMAEVGTYSGDKIVTAHYDGQDQEGQQDSQARGTFNVDGPSGYEGYYGAAFYFQPGTLSGTASAPAKQKGRVDILQWDNATTYGAANKDIGGIRIDDDHVAHLFWDGPNDAEATIGSGFQLREGCWNWVFVNQKIGNAGTAKNDLYLNGEKLFSVTDKNITTGRRVDRLHYGLPRIHEAPQAGTPLDIYVDDAYVGATNSYIVEPRTTACEPQTGARPYYKLEDQQLSDRMGIGVNVASGNLLVSESDLAIAGTRLDLTLSRSYNSARLEGSKMGAGWNLSGGRDVNVRYGSEGQAIYRGATGERVVFKFEGGAYVSPTGFKDLKLTKAGDGTSKIEFLKNRTKLNFHSESAVTQGALKSVVDKNDNTITFNYDANGKLQSITDSQGRTVTVTTDSSGRVTQLRDFDTPTARTWNYTIDTDGELDLYENPEGDDTLYDYSGPNDRLTQITDPNGHQTQIEYENAYPYRVKKIIRAPGQSEAATWTFDYTTDGAPAACETDTKGNPHGKTVVTDPEGHTTTYCWDPLGRIHKVKDALDQERKTTYDADSNVTEFANGTAISNATYGGEGKLTSLKSPTGADTTIDYTDGGHPNFPDKITNASQQGSGQFKDLDYQNNNLKKVSDNVNGVQTNPTALDYNTKGQLTSVIPPRGENQGNPGSNPYETRYTYSTAGNLTQIDRPAPLGGRALETFTYDALSRVKTRTDAQGHVQTYEYDTMDFVQRVGYKNSAGGAEVSSLQFDYDNNGNLICRGENGNCEDPSAVETDYQYDRLNRLKFEDFPNSGVEGDALYTYDRVGNLKTFKESSTTQPQPTITYTYNAVNNLIEMRDPGNLVTTFGPYDERDNRKRTIYPNGVQIDQTFDKSDRVKTIQAKKTSSPTYYVNLQYFHKNAPEDPQNPGQQIPWPSECGTQPTMETDQLKCAKDLVAGSAIKYKYSPNTDRLEEADTVGGTSPTDYKYTYDANSNRKTQEIITPGGTTKTYYNYGYADELCWAFSSDATACRPGPTGSTTYDFTASGNQTGFSGGCVMSYNTRDQNTGVNGCGGGNTTNAQYLGPSNVERVELDGGVKFINSALGLVKRNNPADGGDPTYFRRDDDGKLVQGFRDGAGGAFRKYYYIHDMLGSVIALTDANGDLMRSYAYDPYGNVTDTDRSAGQNAPKDPFRFVSGYQDSGSLHHFGFRFYDGKTGRFTQMDPIDQPGANRFMYVGGDPVNLTDTTGLWFGEKVYKKAKKGLSHTYRKIKGDVNAGLETGGKWGTAGSLGGCAVGTYFADSPSGCGPGAALGGLAGAGSGFVYGYGKHRIKCDASRRC